MLADFNVMVANMIKKEKLRRVLILCCHCLRNLAYYKAGWNGKNFISQNPFWINANGNFLDICVLEWCKLFADEKGKHHWKKVLSDTDSFYDGMLQKLNATEQEIDSLNGEMKTYRDKFIAHLDLEKTMYIPNNLSLAKRMVEYLYDYLLTNEDKGNYFDDAKSTASSFYQEHFNIGKVEYRNIQKP